MHQNNKLIRIKIMEKRLDQIEVPGDLFEKIMGSIRKEERLSKLKRSIYGLFGGMAASFLGLGYFLKIFGGAIANSGFGEYLSLLFSDPSLILSSWQSFLFGLLESLPAMEIAGILLIVFILMQISRKLAADFGTVNELKAINN